MMMNPIVKQEQEQEDEAPSSDLGDIGMSDAEYKALKADIKAAGWLAWWPSSPEEEDETDGQGGEKDCQGDKDEGRVEEHKSIIPSHAWHAVLNWEDGDEKEHEEKEQEEEEEGLSQATTLH